MTLKGIVTALGRAGVVFSVLAFVPNNLVHLTLLPSLRIRLDPASPLAGL